MIGADEDGQNGQWIIDNDAFAEIDRWSISIINYPFSIINSLSDSRQLRHPRLPPQFVARGNMPCFRHFEQRLGGEDGIRQRPVSLGGERETETFRKDIQTVTKFPREERLTESHGAAALGEYRRTPSSSVSRPRGSPYRTARCGRRGASPSRNPEISARTASIVGALATSSSLIL